MNIVGHLLQNLYILTQSEYITLACEQPVNKPSLASYVGKSSAWEQVRGEASVPTLQASEGLFTG